jgi:macrolide transport system ATP-binding/permease protein
MLQISIRRFASLFWKSRQEADLDAELRAHIEMAVDLNLRKGMAAADARREALRSFGGIEQIKEIYRDQRGLPMIETALQDLRYGFRMLRRSPGFSALAIFCLTLGIGANAAVFSWIEGTLLRPFPGVVDQSRLLILAGKDRGQPRYSDVSWPDFLDFRRNCTRVEVVAEKITGSTLSIGERAERAPGGIVSANYFDVMGVRPVLGRGFEPAEEAGRNAHPVVVISYDVWKVRFKGDPGIIGKTQMLNGLPHTIIGVAPDGFYGTFVGYAFSFWVPVSMQEKFETGGYKLEDRGAHWIEGFARLKPGVTVAEAQAEMAAVAKRLETEYPATNRGHAIQLLPLWQAPFNNATTLLPTLRVAFAVVVFVLIIACANVGNLLLVRSFTRRHEMTVRLAIGAGRGRLIQQLLTEGLILAAFGAVGGLLAANWCRNLLVLFIPPRGIPLRISGDLDWRVLAVTAGICLLATILCGLVPSIQAGKIDLAGALKSESGGVVGGRGRSWLRSSLVVIQVALSFILLTGTGLLIQSLRAIRSTKPGFSTDHVLTTAIDLFAAGYDPQRARAFQDELMDRVQGLGGVESAAYSRVAVFSYRSFSSAAIAVDGYQPAKDELPTVEYNEVSPGYLATLGIPLVSGREFTRADDAKAALVAVVNETMAQQYWHGQDPIGQRLQVKDRWMRVIGVAKATKYMSILETATPFVYVPLLQNPAPQVILYLRTPQSPQSMAAALAREIHALDPNLAAYEVITMHEQVERKASSQQIAVALLGIFGGLAVLLAGIGLYGVMSYAVSQSTRELGLRMALGASARNLLRLVISQGLALTAGGVALGAAVALGTTRLLGYLLYKVGPRDPMAFGSAFLVMLVAALAASFLPAWRATRTDPVRALRE